MSVKQAELNCIERDRESERQRERERKTLRQRVHTYTYVDDQHLGYILLHLSTKVRCGVTLA